MGINIILHSLLGKIIFGFVDPLFFLIAENSLQKQLLKIGFVTNDVAELPTGGVLAALAIFVSSLIRNVLKKRFEILKYEWIDSAGILIGAFYSHIFLLHNRNYKKRTQKQEELRE